MLFKVGHLARLKRGNATGLCVVILLIAFLRRVKEFVDANLQL